LFIFQESLDFFGLFSAPEVTIPTTTEISVLATTSAAETVDDTQRYASSTTFTPGWFAWLLCLGIGSADWLHCHYS
jgi:hypothetical protein